MVGQYPRAAKTVRARIRDDAEMAWAWHCSIATGVLAADKSLGLVRSNEIAANVMSVLFGVDSMLLPQWKLACDGWMELEGCKTWDIDASETGGESVDD